MPTLEIHAHADTYVVEDQPDANFGSETVMRVRTELDANRRAYFLLDMDEVPDDFAEWRDPTYIDVQLISTQNPSTENRQINLQDLADTFDEQELTWNNQPGLDLGTIEYDAPTDDWLHFDLLGVLSAIPLSGTWPLRLVDDVEDDDSLEGPFEQECATREHDTRQPAVFVGTYAAQRDADLASEVHVGPKHARLASTVKPGTEPLAGQGRAVGRVVNGFVDPLRDMALVSAKAGSRITRTQDGTTRELTRVVQLVRSRVGADFPQSEPPDRDHLRAGDAVLFALGGDQFEPGATVEWQDRPWTVAGVLAVERIDGVPVYREVGLRRDGVLDQARAVGTVEVAGEGELRWCFVTVREATHADLDSTVDVNTTL